ncbi:MAG: hypothetical protein H0T84_09055 [Tatlockia sp.]|nr:hypothetical protein [Tatlockia sp.]
MKPVSAVFNKRYTLDTKEEQSNYFLNFKIKFDNEEEHEVVIEADSACADFIAAHWINEDRKLESTIPSDWHKVLFATWKENKAAIEEANVNNVFNFSQKDEVYICDLNIVAMLDLKGNIVENKAENESEGTCDAIFSYFHDAYESMCAKTSSFFKPAMEPAIYQFDREKRNSSRLQEDEIVKIENHINLLSKEIKSVWYANKDRKEKKIEGLKAFLDLSISGNDEWDPKAAVSQITTTYPELKMGHISKRTAEILEAIENPLLPVLEI